MKTFPFGGYPAAYFLFFMLVSLVAEPVYGDIFDVKNVNAHSSVNTTNRKPANLNVTTADPPGLNKTTGVYSPSGQYAENGWTNNGIKTNAWVAFELDSVSDIAAMHIWNLGAHSDGNGRDLKLFDMYIATPEQAAALGGNFSSVFEADKALTLNDFTLVQTGIRIAPLNRGTGYAQQVAVDAQNAQWVIFTNLDNYGTNSYIGLGKVAFLDEALNLGIVPTNAASYSTIGGLRTAANTISGRGLDAINAFDPAAQQTIKHAYLHDDSGTTWLSGALNDSTNKLSDQWLAFDLGGTYDLEGMYAWNYSGHWNLKRGIDDFDVYVVKQSDLDNLSSDLLFGDFFKAGVTLDDLLNSTYDLLTPASPDASTPFHMTEAKVDDAEMDSFKFSDVMSEVAWVLLAPTKTHGATDYVGFGQIQFLGSESSTNTPEPATWAMLLLGVATILLVSRKKTRREA